MKVCVMRAEGSQQQLNHCSALARQPAAFLARHDCLQQVLMSGITTGLKQRLLLEINMVNCSMS